MQPRPFRALRYDPARVDLAAVLPAGGVDPRHVERLLDERAEPGDGVDAQARRARLRLSEWRRAGVLRRDEAPALYLVRRRSGASESEALGLLCALAGDGVEPAAASALSRGVLVTPTVAQFADESGRIRRTLESASDREADAAWRDGEESFELFVIDDESTTARLTTLVGDVTVEGTLIAAPVHGAGDDEPRAAALAFLHVADEAWPRPPVGAALLLLGGPL